MKKLRQPAVAPPFFALFLYFLSTQHLHAQTLAFPALEGLVICNRWKIWICLPRYQFKQFRHWSLRDAVSAPNRHRSVRCGWCYQNYTRAWWYRPILYIAGQTAPGEGITVYGNGWSFSGADNTICRYLKIRMGIVGDDGGC